MPSLDEVKQPYRDAPATAVDDRETLAYYELRDRIRALQARSIFLPIAIGLALGVAGLVAHVTGHWSVLGRMPDGSYYLNSVTVLISLILPALPCSVLGYAAYRVIKPFTIRRWRSESARKYGLGLDVLDGCAKGL
jgi:hypothetical protein